MGVGVWWQDGLLVLVGIVVVVGGHRNRVGLRLGALDVMGGCDGRHDCRVRCTLCAAQGFFGPNKNVA